MQAFGREVTVLAKYSSLTRLILIYACILAVLFGSAAFLNNKFSEVTNHQYAVVHTHTVLNELEQTISASKDAESTARGFLLTGKDDMVTFYNAGKLQALEQVSKVRDLTIKNPSQRADLSQIEGILKKRFEALESLIDGFRKTGVRAGPNDLRYSSGETTMRELRFHIDKMKTAEMNLLEDRRKIYEQSRLIFNWILFATTLLTASVISFAFVQIGRSQRRAQVDAELKANEAYEKDLMANLSRAIAGDISFEQAGMAILKFLSEHLGFLASKIWTYRNRELSLLATLGANTQTGSQSGLVRLGAERSAAWKIADVPSDYWKISSGLGSGRPKELVFVPISFQGNRLGVIELAAFESVSSGVLHILDAMAGTMGVGLNAAFSRSQLQELLETTQQQSEELQAQQEELRTNNEELEQQARALESQQQALNVKNRELEVTKVELEEKAADLQRSSQYKSDFLAKMSHELRTPLNGLLILSTLLEENKEKNLTEQQRQFARSINSAGNDLLVLINDILDLSKIEARKLTLRPEAFTLGDLFAAKKRNFEPQINSKKLKFNSILPSDLVGLELFTDRQRLEQILRNFLSNAIKFTETGSVTLKAEADDKKEYLKITVQDTGIGIPKNKQNAIFGAFEQADSSISRKYGGTGLGLTISKELADLLGGEIGVESEEGQGSRFILRLPVRLPDSEANGQPVKHTSKWVPELKPKAIATDGRLDRMEGEVAKALKEVPKGQKTILIVEDDEKFRASVVEAARSYGFHAIEVGDGEVALGILNKYAPDAILLDIKLPGISGLGILEMIKQMPRLRHIPVHMISALEYQHNALRMGALGYLTKPVTIEKVRSALGRIENMISKKLRRVLLIEDDERQNQAIAQLISGSDIEVVSTRTGKSAVAELKKNPIDCVILDLTLPDVSGFDLLSELRALEISLPPVVIYTGRDLSDEEEEYLRKYSESIIIKGARSPERLLDEVNLFLHRVEFLLPAETREMLSSLRSRERSFENKTILVVDDDIRNIFALNSALEARGLQVRVARDGVEALESLEAHHDIDLVLMDIMMPRMDGFEAMRRIRGHQRPRLKNIPIIALTAKAMRDDHEKCIEAGANDYLTKPVNLENLTTVLRVWLSPKGIVT